MTKDLQQRNFDKVAASWDEEPRRLKLAKEVATAIMGAVRLDSGMAALDYGCGTGLVTLALQPHLGRITGADSSRGMLDVLEHKVRQLGLTNVTTRLVDFARGERLAEQFQLIVSSMTLHHVPDLAPLLRHFYELLQPGGVLCLADLDTEDGSFHSDFTGVAHFGLDRVALKGELKECGFRDARDTTAATVIKELGEGRIRDYTVFLITATK